MKQRQIVSFSGRSPDTPSTKDEQIALAREAARKLGVPNAERLRPSIVSAGTHTRTRPSPTLSGAGRVSGDRQVWVSALPPVFRPVRRAETDHVLGRPASTNTHRTGEYPATPARYVEVLVPFTGRGGSNPPSDTIDLQERSSWGNVRRPDISSVRPLSARRFADPPRA